MGSSAAAISDTAASTGTDGWHTAMTWQPGPSRRMKPTISSIMSSRSKRPSSHRHVAGIDPVGQVDVVVRQHGRHRAAQQRGEMPRQRRHHQQLRLVRLHRLAEVHQPAERMGLDGLLGDRHLRARRRSPGRCRIPGGRAKCGRRKTGSAPPRRRAAAASRQPRAGRASCGPCRRTAEPAAAHRIVLDRRRTASPLTARAAARRRKCGTTGNTNLIRQHRDKTAGHMSATQCSRAPTPLSCPIGRQICPIFNQRRIPAHGEAAQIGDLQTLPRGASMPALAGTVRFAWR